MVLCIDIGNQTTALGLFESNKIINPKKIANKELLTLKQHLLEEKVSAIIISSVVPGKNEVFSRILQGFYGITPEFITPSLLKGSYPELGADRVANLFGGKELMGLPVCVLDFGTATAIDVLGTNDEYLGGVIMPGISMELESLHKHTAQLPDVSIVGNRHACSLLGKSTQECIKSGIYWSEYYRISNFISEIKKVTNNPKFIFTGGLGKSIADLLSLPYDEWLTLKGLYSIIHN